MWLKGRFNYRNERYSIRNTVNGIVTVIPGQRVGTLAVSTSIKQSIKQSTKSDH